MNYVSIHSNNSFIRFCKLYYIQKKKYYFHIYALMFSEIKEIGFIIFDKYNNNKYH